MPSAAIRCTSCRAEFDDLPRDCCPSCGTTGVPMAIEDDFTLKINLHELRCLTIWASNYASKNFDADSKRALTGILGAIRPQLPRNVPLTLGDEFQELRSVGDLEVRHPDGSIEKFPKNMPS